MKVAACGAGVIVMTKKDVLREAKSSLYSEGLLWRGPSLEAVPRPIERSWRRALSLGVSPSATAADRGDDLERDERLCDAARPVMARLADDVADMSVAVVLSDASGRIVERIIHDRSLRDRMDGAGAVVGSDYSESAIGTNGLGTVLEDRTPLLVCGAEHFVESLEEMACSGVPIFDPATRRVRGSLSLACRASQANPLMLTLTHAAVRDIEQRLLDGSDRGLHDLASAFAAASRTHRGALALLTPSTVLANTAGLAYVSPADHAVIWDRLVAERLAQPSLLRVELAAGAVDLRAQRLHVTDEELAFQVAISPLRGRRRPVGAAGPRWHPVSAVHDELVSVAGASPVVAIAGEAGTGKTYAARRLLSASGQDFEDLDPSAQQRAWAPSWAGTVRFALASGRRVLLRHVESLPESGHAELRRVLAAASELSDGVATPARLVLTIDRTIASHDLLAVVSRGAAVVELPAVASMRSSIPLLVDVLLRQHPTGTRCAISPAALQAMMRREWPGNIGELRNVVNQLVAKRPGGLIRESDLPASATAQDPGRALSGIERSERAAIVGALREAGGNRAEAARILGIGRTTLYRKLRTLRIDQDDLSTH